MTPPKPSPADTVHLAQDGSADVLRAWCGVEESDAVTMTDGIWATTCLACLEKVASCGDLARQRMVTLRKDTHAAVKIIHSRVCAACGAWRIGVEGNDPCLNCGEMRCACGSCTF